jgi:hypothetical protein
VPTITIQGQWTKENSGGPITEKGFPKNEQFSFSLEAESDVLVILSREAKLGFKGKLGFYLFPDSGRRMRLEEKKVLLTGEFTSSREREYLIFFLDLTRSREKMSLRSWPICYCALHTRNRFELLLKQNSQTGHYIKYYVIFYSVAPIHAERVTSPSILERSSTVNITGTQSESSQIRTGLKGKRTKSVSIKRSLNVGEVDKEHSAAKSQLNKTEVNVCSLLQASLTKRR